MGCVAETIDARHDAARGVVVCGELFVARLASGHRVVNDDIGEGAANIDPHPKALHTLSPSTEPGQTPFISQGNEPRMPSALGCVVPKALGVRFIGNRPLRHALRDEVGLSRAIERDTMGGR